VIERYCYPEMRAVWSAQNKFAKWLEVELVVAEALAEIGEIPNDAARALRKNARFDAERIEQLEGLTPSKPLPPGEQAVRHDMLAFLKSVSESLGEEAGYLHFGVTSYDIEDTALALLLRESCEMLEKDLDVLCDAVRERAREHKHTPMMGRTHGVHAEPITFGVKLAVWLAALQRGKERLLQAKESISCGKISGAVGVYANIDPRVEEHVCARLRLKPAAASSQILQRDRHAHYVCALALIAGSLEQFATEIRNLQRTEILEVEEPFRAGQRGSSAMPHKRNPIACETITSLARVMRSYVIPAIEAIATWHERDITNSAAERIVLPDSSILADYMMRRFTDVVGGMRVYPERMKQNMERTGPLAFSESVMLALVRKGLSRDEAYSIVQKHAMAAWEKGDDFVASLSADPHVHERLSAEELKNCFDLKHHLRQVDRIFERMGI
jgi:adenylosuccinate lyase